MNRLVQLAGAVSLLAAVVSFAADPAPPAPTPGPAPVAAPAAPQSYSSVLVLPFAPVAGASDWIGKGVQEDLATELVRQSKLDVLTPADVQAVSDPAAAAKVGRDKGASLVAFGSYQILETEVRINGQLVDAATGKPLAALKATGQRRDLFHMEDLLAAQAVASLPPSSIRVGGGAYAASSEPAPAPGSTSTQSYQPYNAQGYYVTPGPDYTPAYNYAAAETTAPTTTYDGGYTTYPQPYYNYGYPWYGYDYPFWGGSGFFFIGGGGRHHDHDGHWHDGHWQNGTEGHNLAFNGGLNTRSPVVTGGTRSINSFGGTGFRTSTPSFQGSIGARSGAGAFRGGGFSGFHGSGGFSGGFHGGGGGHR